MIKKCIICNKEFNCKPCKSETRTYCSHPCYWNAKSLWKYPQAWFQKWHINYISEKWRLSQSIKISWINHFFWKWDSASVRSMHSYVKRHKWLPQICEKCWITRRTNRLDWANIDHSYKRNLSDYLALCRSCHRKHDIKNNNYKIWYFKNNH